MARRYPQEFHDFMRSHVEGRSARELAELASAAFGIEFTEPMCKAYKSNHGLKSGTPTGKPRGSPSKVFPAEVCEYIRANYKGVGPKEMTERINSVFGTAYTARQLCAYYKNHKLNSGLTGHFEKGHTPPNKGRKGYHAPGCEKSWYKPGSTPANKLPIGTILQKSDGYMWEKIGEGARDWRQKHILVWEAAHGPIPAGYVLTFKDSDKTNYALDNLALISMAESIELTRRGLRTADPALTETGIHIARLNCKIFKHRRKEHRNEQ